MHDEWNITMSEEEREASNMQRVTLRTLIDRISAIT